MKQWLCLPLLPKFSIIDLHATNSSITNGWSAVKFSTLKHSAKPAMFLFVPAKSGTVKTKLYIYSLPAESRPLKLVIP